MTIEELRRLEQAATPGEWDARPMGFNVSEDGIIVEAAGAEIHPHADVVAKVGVIGKPRSAQQLWSDAAFIAAARNAAPALLRAVEAAARLDAAWQAIDTARTQDAINAAYHDELAARLEVSAALAALEAQP